MKALKVKPELLSDPCLLLDTHRKDPLSTSMCTRAPLTGAKLRTSLGIHQEMTR